MTIRWTRRLFPLILLFAQNRLLAQGEEYTPKERFPEQTAKAGTEESTPKIIRWMLQPVQRGMFIRLPIIDTDPNRGVTVGVMPIWVFHGNKSERIQTIYAPSLTYNA